MELSTFLSLSYSSLPLYFLLLYPFFFWCSFLLFFSFVLPFLLSSHHTTPEVVVDPLPLPKCEVGVSLETVEGVDLDPHGEWDIEMVVGVTMRNKDHMVVTPGGMEGEVDTNQEEEEEEVSDQTVKTE